MATTANVYEDKSLLSRLDQKLHQLESLLMIMGGLGVAGLVLLAVASVAGRWFWQVPLAGYIDWIQQFMPVIAFAGIAYALRSGAHIRMDILLNRVKGRWLYALEFVTTLLTLLFIISMVWGSFAHFGRSFDLAMPMFSRDSSIDIGLPLWPAKLLVPIAFFVMSLRACLQLWAYGRAFTFNDAQPVAVPLRKDIKAQAEDEAAQLTGKD